MNDSGDTGPGRIVWTDLTVPDAEAVRDFYAELVGWEPAGVDMGGYEDFAMNLPGTGNGVAGICHARGVNADLPAQWLIYITVANLDASIAACIERGGSVVAGPRNMGKTDRLCVIRDPAGAVCALYETGSA